MVREHERDGHGDSEGSRQRRHARGLPTPREAIMTKPQTLFVKPGDLPRPIVLLLPDGAGHRQVVYVLRVTRSGGLLLNKDELAPEKQAA
jgi:hypothetical protein